MIRFLQTPTKAKKIVLSGILMLVCVAMVWYLVPSFTDAASTNQAGTVATVGSERVSTEQVERMANRLLEQNRVPPQYRSFYLNQARKEAVEQLISVKALEYEAARLGIKVTDAEVKDDIRNMPEIGELLFPEGNFIGEKKYEEQLTLLGTTPAEFEQETRETLLRRKLLYSISDTVTASQADIEKEFRKRNTKVRLEYALLLANDVANKVNPSEAELKVYFETHKGNYVDISTEKRHARYVLLGPALLGSAAKVTDDEVQRYYDQNRARFRTEDEVNVRHILVRVPSGSDEKAVAAARAKAEGILKQLRAGAGFDDLAKKNSDDTGSAQQGGSLGWVGRGRLVPEFEQAMFSLPKGQPSDPVKTTFGFHIIRVDDRRSGGTRPLDQVRDSIVAQLQAEKSRRLLENLAETVQEEARRQGLNAAAARRKLQVLDPGFFTRKESLPGIGSSPEFIAAVFSAKEKTPPATVGLGAPGYAVYEVLEVRPPSLPTFEEARAKVFANFREDRGLQVLAAKTQEMADRAKTLHDLKKAAAEQGATLKTTQLVGPTSQVPDLGNMGGAASVAFDLKVGESSGPLQAGINGAVLSVLERQEPPPTDLQKQQDLIRESLENRARDSVLQLYIRSLRERLTREGKLTINQQELNSLTKGSDLNL